MSAIRYAVLAAALLTLGGACVHGKVFRIDPAVRPPTNPDSVQLLGKEPQEPYTVVGLVTAWRETWLTGIESVRKRLQKEAARLGGHALLFDSESFDGEQGRLSAKVIVFQRD